MPIHPLSFDFTNDNYLLAYYMLFSSTGIAGQDYGLCFNRDEYKTNNCLFAFDIVQSLDGETGLNLEKSGTVKLEIRFGAALSESVHCIVFSEHQSVLEVDKFRQILP